LLGGDVKQPWLMSKHDVIHKTGSTERLTVPPEEDQATATGNMQQNFGEDRTCSSSGDMLADRQTHTDSVITILHSPGVMKRVK